MTFIVALTVLLASCQIRTTADYYGQGPINLSPVILAGFEKYKKSAGAGAFAISDNGRTYGYSFCSNYSNCSGNEVTVALDSCESNSRGRLCWVYAVGKQVVWNVNRPSRSSNLATQNKAVVLAGQVKKFTNQNLCTQALNSKFIQWDDKFPVHVAEAKSRGLNENKCAQLLGRNSGSQNVSTVRPQPSIASTSGTKKWINRSEFLGLDNNVICERAIQITKPNWISSFSKAVAEAKSRGLTEARCANLIGRFSSSAKSDRDATKQEPKKIFANVSELARSITVPKPKSSGRTTDSITVYNDCKSNLKGDSAVTHRKCTCWTKTIMEDFSESNRDRILNAISSGRKWSIDDAENEKVKACFS
jgi:hypothetical protein